MLKMFQYALVVCTAIATFLGGAHVVQTYLGHQLETQVKAIVAADLASKPQVEE